MTEIIVCQSGSCRRRGSEAILLEIEELASCKVRDSGCLGLCNQAPAVAIVERRKRRQPKVEYFTKVDTLQESIKVIEKATGEKVDAKAAANHPKLHGVRAARRRDHSMSVYRWKDALEVTMEQMRDGHDSREVRQVYQELLEITGYSNGLPSSPTMPNIIARYALWTLESVTVVSRHSAVFHFSCKDRKRGTPNPRGGGRRLPAPKTWHTTLLAPQKNERPLPWVERDYTPISSAKEWEQGKCDILIKIYPNGAATSWLWSSTLGAKATSQGTEANTEHSPLRVFLSQPVATLSVPMLVPAVVDGSESSPSFRPESILLVLAGTGVVALPQILDHRDPYNKIGIATRKWQQLRVPIDLVLSCRKDDVLMVSQLVQYCQEAQTENEKDRGVTGIRNCTLLLTSPSDSSEMVPYLDVSLESCLKELNTLQQLPNVRIMEHRLNQEIVAAAVAAMTIPCRIVVSGPSSFNAAARNYLLQCPLVETDSITVLEA